MENMKEAKAIQSLDEMTSILKNELENIAEGFIAVGYYLKKTRDDELYKEKGYKSIFEYAQSVFGISRYTATRFMETNDRYSIGGYSPQIEERYRGYGSSKLTEMLQLPEDIRESVPAEATVRDIREAKSIVRETESRYGGQMELCDIAQKEAGEDPEWLEELARELFREDCREKFKEFVIWLKSPGTRGGITEDILALINPTKFKMVRLERANVMMTEGGIRVMPYRNQGENKEHTYPEFAQAFERVFFPDGMDGKNAEDAYREFYREPLMPETEKPGNTECGGQSVKETAPKEKAGAKAKPKTTEKPGNAECGGQSGQTYERDPKTEPKMPENPMDAECGGHAEGELPGQMGLTEDFPEYCPGDKEPREEPGAPEGETEADAGEEEPANEAEAAAGCPYKSRFEYLRTLSRPEYARHMAEAMKGLKGLSFRDLTQERIWEEWLEGLVDEAGRTIEEG